MGTDQRAGTTRNDSHRLRYRLLLAASVVITVAVIAGGLARILDGSSSGLRENVRWALLGRSDPGDRGDAESFC